MAFLSKLSEIGGVISSKSQEAANKAKELSGVTQIKTKISSMESNLRQAYTELGDRIYKENPDLIKNSYPELYERMEGFRASIEQYQAEIEGLKQATADANAAIQEAQKARVAAAQQAAAEEAARKAELAAQAAASMQQSVADAAGQVEQAAGEVQAATENVVEEVQSAAEGIDQSAEI